MTGIITVWLIIFATVVVCSATILSLRRRIALLETLLTSFHTPILYYDRRGKLVYSNDHAREVFSDISDQIDNFSVIESSAKPDGPDFYMTDRFGNGYRLEISRGLARNRFKGHLVRVKGYAKGRI